MRNISVEIKVGLAVILAAAILIFSVMWVKSYKFNQKRYSYSVLFPNVGSLEVGDPVSVLGVKKGEVENVNLVGNDVLVTFKLIKDVNLKSDAKFTVMNIGLMGERYIAIVPGVSQDNLDLTKPVHGYYDTGIPEVMGLMGAAVDEVRHLVAVLQGTIGTPAFTTAMTDIIGNLQKIASDWGSFTTQNKEKMTEAIDNLAVSSAKFRSLIDNNDERLEKTMDNLSRGSEKFAIISERLDSLSNSVHGIVTQVSDGKGSVGMALNDDALYKQLLSASNNLDALIEDFKKHPKKYIHFSVF